MNCLIAARQHLATYEVHYTLKNIPCLELFVFLQNFVLNKQTRYAIYVTCTGHKV